MLYNSAFHSPCRLQYSYTATGVGVHTVKIICGETEKIINILVEKLNIEISDPVISEFFEENGIDQWGLESGDRALLDLIINRYKEIVIWTP